MASMGLILSVSKVSLAFGVRVGSFVAKDNSRGAHEGTRGREVPATAASLGGTDKGQICLFTEFRARHKQTLEPL